MIICTHCGRHALSSDQTCPHCTRTLQTGIRTTGALIMGLALAGAGCDSSDKAVALYGVAFTDSGESEDTGDTGENSETEGTDKAPSDDPS